MSAITTVATSNGTATTPVVTLPNRVTVDIAGAKVHAASAPNGDKTGIKYEAKARVLIAENDTRSDDEILTAIAGLVDFEGVLMPLGSKYRGDHGECVVGRSAPRLNKAGEVIRAAAPMVCLWQVTVLGDGEGIAYQVLVKLITGKNSKGRFVSVSVDVTKRPVNEFKPVGEVEGNFSF